MGIQDRDYVRSRPVHGGGVGGGVGGMLGQGRYGSLGGQSRWSVTTWIIVLCVGVFVLDLLLVGSGLGYVRLELLYEDGVARESYVTVAEFRELSEAGALGKVIDPRVGPIERWGYFSADTAVLGGQLWRWLGFQFLHAGGWHLFGNMLGLYFFGSMIEQALGRRRYLAFYLLCGIAGPLIYLLFAAAGFFSTSVSTPLIGASAGVFGVLAAAALIAPNTTVMLLFPPIPLKLRTVALLLMGWAAFTVFTNGNNAGGEAAHIGGAVLGYLLIRHPNWLKWAEAGPKTGLPKPKSSGYMRYTG
ncbi:MAG: rhomboid family intramembrane serine protease [Planctomycetota bacterium]